jgi:hypothetical protein
MDQSTEEVKQPDQAKESKELIYIKSLVLTLFGKSFDKYYVDFNNGDSYKCSKMIYRNCAFVAVSTKVQSIRKLFSGLSSISKFIKILFLKDGIYITEMDEEEKLLLLIKLDADKFLGYYCPENFYIKFKTRDLELAFEKTRKQNQLVIFSVSSFDCLDIHFEEDSKCSKDLKPIHRPVYSVARRKREKNAKKAGQSTEEKNDPAPQIGINATFPFKVIFPVETLNKIKTEIGKKNQKKKLTITMTSEFINFCMGSSEKKEIHNPPLVFDNLVSKKFDPQKASIDFNYLKKILSVMTKLKTFAKSKSCLSFSSNHSFIIFTQDISNIGMINYILSKTLD